jgi:Lon protease-like protein
MVLFPGVVLPLHVFEERYRILVRELLEHPEDEREFGVVTIRQGREVGADGVQALHEVGCTAKLRRAQSYDDGRFDIVTTGTTRFRLSAVLHDRPYLVGEVELLADEVSNPDEQRLLGAAVRDAFVEYLMALAESGASSVEVPELPAEDLALSYLVASTVLVDLDDRQALLAEVDGPARLRSELTLLRREIVLLREFAAVPAPELARTPTSPN